MMRRGLYWVLSLLLVGACQAANPGAPSPNFLEALPGQTTRTPFQPIAWTLTPAPTLTPVATPSPTPPPYSLWLDPRLPDSFRQAIDLPQTFHLLAEPASATHQLQISPENPISYWVYALVAPFPTVRDDLPSASLVDLWQGHAGADGLPGSLLVDAQTRQALAALWGEPAPGAVQVLATEALLAAAWEQKPAWAIIPFDHLQPEWKVLAVDGISPLSPDFDWRDYELALPISLTGDQQTGLQLPLSNRDPAKLTSVILTGVTALVRATAFAMERQGVNYPAQDVRDWLVAADITHISNEVPFAEDCPYPNPLQEGMRFCSSPAYLALLESIGTDVVELTGDHFADWGAAAMHYTLALYDAAGWQYYGGGVDLESGRQAVLIEHHGNRLAFIGCNAKGGGFAQASSTNPGAVACDFPYLEAEIQRLQAEGYRVIATFQHFEYYTYAAQPNQIRDAERLAQAGATIVSGSQAHQPQALAFSNGSLIHHGLGNLFFDQLDVSEATRQAFIDRHIFYNGQHISTELLTIYFVDYARARPMTPEERANLLQTIFTASGW